jgi:hypothetical protein
VGKGPKRRAHASFTETDQKIAATIGERKRVEKRTAFDSEPLIV